jgi:hypothetical protein
MTHDRKDMTYTVNRLHATERTCRSDGVELHHLHITMHHLGQWLIIICVPPSPYAPGQQGWNHAFICARHEKQMLKQVHQEGGYLVLIRCFASRPAHFLQDRLVRVPKLDLFVCVYVCEKILCICGFVRACKHAHSLQAAKLLYFFCYVLMKLHTHTGCIHAHT